MKLKNKKKANLTVYPMTLIIYGIYTFIHWHPLFKVKCDFILKLNLQLHRVTWYTRKDYEEPELTDYDEADDEDDKPPKPKPKRKLPTT